MEDVSFVYRFGTAEFDHLRYELKVAGLPVDVERRALEVLAHLLQNAGLVVSKEALLREVWAGRITVEKVLPNAINKLRRALGEANATRIRTHARMGYSLDGVVVKTANSQRFHSQFAPRAGDLVPGRPNLLLSRELGRTAGSQVWLAEHAQTGKRRVYKFGLDANELRRLKREAILLSVLRQGLEDCSRFVELIDWNFDQPPYFLECEYAGLSLPEWADIHLLDLGVEQRIALFIEIAEGVASAHSVGVLHKDIKAANVLIDGSARWHVRLSDFGSARLLETERLESLGIPALGMTMTDQHGPSQSGTFSYMAPELIVGGAPTVKSDVFSLGVLLYQLICGRLRQPMASGWEADVNDELVERDILDATNGDPSRRLASASELVHRLRQLPRRRELAHSDAEQREQREQLLQQLRRARARRPYLLGLVASLVVGVAAALYLEQIAVGARDQAQLELARVGAVTRFVTEDLIGRANPLVSAKGTNVSLAEALAAARPSVVRRFADQPLIAATIHASLARYFEATDQWSEAEGEARSALTLFDRHSSSSTDAIRTRAVLIGILSRLGQFESAREQSMLLQALVVGAPTEQGQYWLAQAQSKMLLNQSDFTAAVPKLRLAISLHEAIDPKGNVIRDHLRLDLVTALAMSGEAKRSKAEANQLIAEASARTEDSALIGALAKMAMARALGEDHAQTEALLLAAQPVIVDRLGPTHTRHLRLLNELMEVAFRQADWQKAQRLALQLHDQVAQKLGPSHAVTFVSLANLGRTYFESGDARRAGKPLREAYRQLVLIVGTDDPQAQDAGFVLAAVELELGHIVNADALISQLRVEALEQGRATGRWPAALDLLRGISMAQRGDKDRARAVLTPALSQLESEQQLAAPSRLYVNARSALSSL